MKELIEKINQKITNYEKIKESRNESTLGDLYLLAHLEILKDLEKIQQQEEKPFDPLELGFILHKDNDVNLLEYINKNNSVITKNSFDDNSYRIYFFNKITNFQISIDCIKIPNHIYFQISIDCIKIPNHRFGKELLQNLGVIE